MEVENGSHSRHKVTLGVNWAMLGSERDGEIGGWWGGGWGG